MCDRARYDARCYAAKIEILEHDEDTLVGFAQKVDVEIELV